MSLGCGRERCGADLQSTNPFQAETDARRAVSTVPPMTTSFWDGVRRRSRR